VSRPAAVARGWVAVAAALTLGACVGPSPEVQPAPVPAPHGTPIDPAMRAVLDSITTAVTAVAPEPAPVTLAIDTVGQLSWLGMLRDTEAIALVRAALQHNRDYQAATARVAEYQAMYVGTRSAMLPELDANGAVSANKSIFGSLVLPPYDLFNATASVSWEVDFWGRVRRTTQASRYDWSGRLADRRAIVLSLVSSVVTAYLQLRELDEDVAISQQTLASRRETYRLARERFDQGLISELDVRQFESEVATSAVSLASFLRLRDAQENALSVLIGQAPGPIGRGGPLDSAITAVQVPDSVPSTLVLRRPDVMSAEADWSAARARVGAAEAARLPRFAITASYGRQHPSLDGLFGSSSEIYTAQLGVSVPLFAGGRVSSSVEAAAAHADEARLHYEQTVLNALRETSDALDGIRLSRDQLTAQETQTRALRRALELAQRRYASGVASYLDVLDVERGLFAAELALAQARRQYLAATVELYKAVGGSWDDLAAHGP